MKLKEASDLGPEIVLGKLIPLGLVEYAEGSATRPVIAHFYVTQQFTYGVAERALRKVERDVLQQKCVLVFEAASRDNASG
jgi:hypothetical protein